MFLFSPLYPGKIDLAHQLLECCILALYDTRKLLLCHLLYHYLRCIQSIRPNRIRYQLAYALSQNRKNSSIDRCNNIIYNLFHILQQILVPPLRAKQYIV